MSISQKIEDLITASNAVTGESRTDLTSCIQDLKDGYGGGGVQSDVLVPVELPLNATIEITEV